MGKGGGDEEDPDEDDDEEAVDGRTAEEGREEEAPGAEKSLFPGIPSWLPPFPDRTVAVLPTIPFDPVAIDEV